MTTNLGSIHFDVGNLDQAYVFYERALTIKKKTLGREHAETASSYNNLDLVLQFLETKKSALCSRTSGPDRAKNTYTYII